MKKPTVAITLALLLVCGIGGFALKGRNQAKNPDDAAKKSTETVKRGDIVVSVIETGSIDANKVVEVKGRVTGRLQKLFVDEGDRVHAGQLVARIDPQETELLLRQNEAQLRGAESAVHKTEIEIAQRLVTAQAAYDQAKAKVAQLALDLKAQPTFTKAAIEQAQTALNTALEEKKRLTESAHPTQRTSFQNAVQEAQANYDNAEREFKRQSDLATKGYVSGKTVDVAKLDMDVAHVHLDSAQRNLALLDSELSAQMSKADEQIAQYRAALRTAQANGYAPESKRQDYLSAVAALDTARAALDDPKLLARDRESNLAAVDQLKSVVDDARRQLGETEIKAPIDGVVTKKELQVGELATGLSQFSSGTPIVKIEDRTGMLVKLDINEIDMAKLKLGMSADVDVDAIPARTYHGVVKKIAPASKDAPAGSTPSSDAVVKYEVEIRLADADGRLRTGMSAKCTVNVVHMTNVLTLPLEFIIKDGRKNFVELPAPTPKSGVSGGATAKPVRLEVQLGAQTGALVEILSGLKEGDVVARPHFSGPARTGFMQTGPDDQ